MREFKIGDTVRHEHPHWPLPGGVGVIIKTDEWLDDETGHFYYPTSYLVKSPNNDLVWFTADAITLVEGNNV